MAIEVERLVATLEANFTKYDKALNKALGSTDRTFTRIEQRGRQMEARIAAVGGSLKNFGVGVLAGVGLASVDGLVRGLRSAVKEAADLVDLSQRIGINTDDLQAMLYGFNQAGADADTVTKSLEQWARRLGEAYTQGGPLAELFKANSMSLTDGEGRLRSSVELLGDMSKLIKNAGSDQERLALAQIAFGKGGSAMVLGMKDGLDGVIRSGKEAGNIMSEDILKTAAQIDEEFDKLSATVSTQLKTGLIEVADVLVTIVKWVTNFGDVLEKISGIPAPAWWGLVEGVATGAAGFAGAGSGVGAGAAILMRQKQQQDEAARQAVKKGDRVVPPLSDGEFDERFNGTRRTVVPNFGAGRGGGGGSSRERLGDFDRETRQIRERTAAMVGETAALTGLNPLVDDYGFALEKARAEHDLLAAAQAQGVAITPALREQISTLATGYATAAAAASQLQAQQDRVRSGAEEFSAASKDVLGGFISDIREGASATEALANSLKKVGDKLLDMALSGLFSGGGLFGGKGLLGGIIIPGILHKGGVAGRDGYGHGRSVSPGVFAGAPRYHSGGVAGMRPGEVPAILQRGELVLPKTAMKGGASSGKQAVSIKVNVDGANGDQHVVALVRQGVSAGLQAYDKQLDRSIGGKMQAAQIRYG